MIIGEEGEFVEFKKTTGELKDSMDAISAFLNKHNKGTVYYGVDNNGFVKGQQITDSTLKDISRTISDAIEPRITPTIEKIVIDSKEVVKVSFYGSNRPYSSYGKYFVRVGSENRKMSTEELKRLIKNEGYSSKWEEQLTTKTIDDLDDKTLLDFYNSAKECGRLEMKEYNKEKLLSVLDIVRDGKLKNAGYVLFGKNVNIGLKLATYATDNKVTFNDLKLKNDNVYNLVGMALEYILDKINWRVEIGSRKRNEIPEIPADAIREIIVNAFAHANYESVPEIEIGIHPNKIEIYNPGTFPDNLTPFDFISSNLPSFKRNKLILDILFRSKDVEKSGTGFQRVNELCNQQGVSWTFRKVAYGFFFEFIRTNVHLNVQTNVHLNEQEQIIFNLINDNERITKEELALRINKSEKTVQRIISKLVANNLIERIGSNKDGYWKVK